FARGPGHGLLQLGAAEVGTPLPAVFGYWREIGGRYVTAVCTRPDIDEGREPPPIPPPSTSELEALASVAPPMTGAEYLTASLLLSLLLPVQRAAEQCAWLKRMVEAGEIFHPLRWTPAEAFQLLTDVPRLESAGVIVRVPGTWRANRPMRPQVTATVGGKAPS